MGIEAIAPLTTTWYPLNDNLLSWQYEGQILELGVCGLNPIYKCLAQYAINIQQTVKKDDEVLKRIQFRSVAYLVCESKV
jgi:hypothetical protein